jgi:magnesium transporter
MLYLSQVIGRPVRDGQGEPIGKVADLIVALGGPYPPVTGLVVQTGRRRIFLPWSSVAELDTHGARLATRTIDIGRFRQRPDEILLETDLIDKQIVDIDGRKVVRVNDLRLDEINGEMHLVAVDVGAAGLLRRLGFEGAYRLIARNLRLPLPECRTRASPSSIRPTSPTSSTSSPRRIAPACWRPWATRPSPMPWRRWSRRRRWR